jgi:arabinofuranosyltransferase
VRNLLTHYCIDAYASDVGLQVNKTIRSFLRQRSATLWLICCAIFASVPLLLLRLEGLMADDGFIYWRVARNFVENGVFGVNQNSIENSGVTSPLYTLMLSLGWWLTKDLWMTTIVIFSAASALSAWALLRLGPSLQSKFIGVFASLFLVLSPWILSTRGLESVLVLTVLSLALLLYQIERPKSLGIVIGIGILVRFDVLLLLLLILVFYAVRKKANSVFGLLKTAIPSLVFSFLLIYLLTGQLFPNTMGAKMAQGRSGFWGNGFQFAKNLWLLPDIFSFQTWFYALVLLALMGISYGLMAERLRNLTSLILLFGVSHYVIYAFLLRTPNYHWYYAPEVWALSMLAAIGAHGLFADARRLADSFKYSVAVTLSATALLFGFIQIPKGYSYTAYNEAGDWLRTNTEVGSTVAAAEIGVIGWSSRREMVDFLGLLDDDAVVDLKNKDLTSWIYRREPDYFVAHTPMWHFEKVMELAWFKNVYSVVFETNNIIVYKKIGKIPLQSSIQT